jgi:hypothetical protein
MSSPRPSRGARWGIGLSAAAVALFVAVVAGAVALGQAAGGGGECVSDPGAPGIFCTDDSLTEEALADVLRVVVFDPSVEGTGGTSSDDPFALGPGWYLDLEYTTVDGEQVRAIDIAWPRTVAEPVEGSTVRIAYDPADPEFSVGSAEALAAARAPQADEADGPAAALLWTAGLAATLAATLLGVTVLWARRAPRPERAAPVGWYGSPYGYPVAPPGYAQPYPQQPYPQQPYPQAYPPQPYGQPYGYPPQPYPQQYPQQPYPQPYPPQPYPQQYPPPAVARPTDAPAPEPAPQQSPPPRPPGWDLPA